MIDSFTKKDDILEPYNFKPKIFSPVKNWKYPSIIKDEKHITNA